MNTSHNKKLFITQKDKAVIDEINLKRDMIHDGVVWEAIAVAIRLWLPENSSKGVVDICIPVSEDNAFGFKDKWDATVSKDNIGVYRLSDRGRDKDIPKHFYKQIEDNMLIPVSMGAIIPYDEHVYGKGSIYKIANIKAMEWRLVIEDVEIISPYENAQFVSAIVDESLPKNYEKEETQKRIDYKKLINRGESENVEFKSSARWDYKQNCKNVEMQKAVIKSLAGFLNSNGGFLFIGVDDHKNAIGIQNDLKTLKKKSMDGYQLFLSDLICEKIGSQFSSCISIEFPQINGQAICVLKVDKSKNAAFVTENNRCQFYIRANNSTRELDSKDTHEYIMSHFRS